MMVSVADLRAAKHLSTATWDSLSPEDRRYAHSLLGSMYHYYNDLATHTAFANGRIDMLQEALTDLRKGIEEHATDTVWYSPIETACDRITAILGDQSSSETVSVVKGGDV